MYDEIFHMYEHDTAVETGTKCVWKFDIKYSYKIWGLIENHNLLYYQIYFWYCQRTEKGFCMSACLLYKYSVLHLCFSLTTRWNCQQTFFFFPSALLAIITEGKNMGMLLLFYQWIVPSMTSSAMWDSLQDTKWMYYRQRSISGNIVSWWWCLF